ncbi:MAG TPA: histidine phosphatase family protein [Candidatus Cybelea sp.]|jgi:alpha-ribazole phosphatase/probable phosphoglycerate mutase
MLLTLIRHGPTEWNASRRFQGRTNVPLSPTGRAHALAAADALKSKRIDRIYSSDLQRAFETAQIVGEPHDAEILTDERLREFDFGAWEGLTWVEIVARNPHLYGLGSTAAKHYTPEGGESFEDVCVRVGSFLDDLGAQRLERAVVVTHAGPLHAMFTVLKLSESAAGGEHLSLSFAPGSISQLRVEGGEAKILRVNDRRHIHAED